MKETPAISPELIRTAAETCEAIRNAGNDTRQRFVRLITRLLPRLYFRTTDLEAALGDEDEFADTPEYLSEQEYDRIRGRLAALFADTDTYLETFEADMKYSDTPIAASISEGLADIFQPLYNFLNAVDDATPETVLDAARYLAESFRQYWAQTLCNVMRPLNALRYDDTEPDSEIQ